MTFETSLIVFLSICFAFGNIYYCQKQSHDWLHPLLILSTFYLVFYLGKYIYNSLNGELIFSYNYRRTVSQSTLDAAALYSLVAFGLFSIGFMAPTRALTFSATQRRTKPISLFLLLLTGTISVGSMIIAYWEVDLSNLTSAAGNRFELFAERGYLLVLSTLFKICFFLWLAFSSKRPKIISLLGLASIAILIDSLTGSRGKVVFENILPLIYLLHHKKFIRVNLSKALTILMLGVLFSIAYRAATRDILMESNRDASASVIIANAMADTFTSLYEGPEAPFFDTTALLIDSNEPLLFGASLAAVLAYPIPRSMFEEKPRGGSATLTEQYFPDYYYPYNIELAFPFQSEVLANFGLIGVFIMFWLGAASGYAYRSIRTSPPFLSIIFIFLTIRSILLFRNDFFNNFTSLLGFVVVALLIYRINSLKFKR
jgi:hypothetical protein